MDKASAILGRYVDALETTKADIWMAPLAHVGADGLTYPGPIYQSANVHQAPEWTDLPKFGPMVAPSHLDTAQRFGVYMSSMTPNVSQWQPHLNSFATVDNPMGFAGEEYAFGVAYFPVVYRLSPSDVRTSGPIGDDVVNLHIVPFAVTATSGPWPKGNMHEPLYQSLRPHPNSEFTLHVDMAYLARDENNILSILASVRTLLPQRWKVKHCYLTIAPCITNDYYGLHVERVRNILGDKELTQRQAFMFEGASLGLAVAAAIMGAPPMLYTGYLSQMGTDSILTVDSEDPVQEVIAGANMVENVDDVELKAFFAMYYGLPFVLPLNATWRKEIMEEAVNHAIERTMKTETGSQTLLSVAHRHYDVNVRGYKQTNIMSWAKQLRHYIYTTAKRSAGIDIAQSPTLMFGAVNLSDVQILAATAAAFFFDMAGPSGWFSRHEDTEHIGAYMRDYAHKKLILEHATKAAGPNAAAAVALYDKLDKQQGGSIVQPKKQTKASAKGTTAKRSATASGTVKKKATGKRSNSTRKKPAAKKSGKKPATKTKKKVTKKKKVAKSQRKRASGRAAGSLLGDHQGRAKRYGGSLGLLKVPSAVKKAVLRTMEGGKDIFKLADYTAPQSAKLRRSKQPMVTSTFVPRSLML